MRNLRDEDTELEVTNHTEESHFTVFKFNLNNLNKTTVERDYYNSMKQSMPCIGATCDYRYRLQKVNDYLTTVYGDLADWNRSIGNHLAMMQTDISYKAVDKIDDIPLIPEDALMQIIAYGNMTANLANEAKDCVEKWKGNKDLPALERACVILGILPKLAKNTEPVLNHFLINFPISDYEREKLYKDVMGDNSKLGLLGMAADMLAMAYTDQYYATFPYFGTMIMQPKTISYYRGENAYYGTSRPAIYRNQMIREMPNGLKQAVRIMKYDECGARVIDRIKSTVDWSIRVSDINYMALMQHYGLATEMMDITSDFKVALFFACCKWVGDGTFGHWEPLKKSDFENVDSRPEVAALGGDSRYGIIYRMASEVEDLFWTNVNPYPPELLGKTEDTLTVAERDLLELWNHVVPVGYQPLSRSSIQSAYAFINGNPDYDMLKDPRFSRQRFRLTENLCEWIYQEMDKGDKIYPTNDVPGLEKYIKPIQKNPTVFSKSTFEFYCEKSGITEDQAVELKQRLLEYGYMISDKDIDYISEDELKVLNDKYTIEYVKGMYDINPGGRPFLVM